MMAIQINLRLLLAVNITPPIYDLDNWKGIDSYHFNVVVTKQDMDDTFNHQLMFVEPYVRYAGVLFELCV
jgi:hypothetical protein